MASERQTGTFKGIVYGDLVGAPYMIENTYNRYFPLGESRRAFSHGKVRSFFPEVTEVSHGAAAVCNWLSTSRDHPTAEALQKCLRDQFLSHPMGRLDGAHASVPLFRERPAVRHSGLVGSHPFHSCRVLCQGRPLQGA